MLYQEILNRETASLPEYLKRELLDFLYFLKKKGKKHFLYLNLRERAIRNLRLVVVL